MPLLSSAVRSTSRFDLFRFVSLRWLMMLAVLVLPLSACHEDFALYETPRPQAVRPVAVAVAPATPRAPTPAAARPAIVVAEPAATTASPAAPMGTTPGAPTMSVPGTTPSATSPPPVEAESPLIAQQRRGCESEGGVLRPRPGGLLACVRVTGDSGRACTASSQCQSECLARSGTCAPVTPLFGCHEVLLASGSRVTQCVD